MVYKKHFSTKNEIIKIDFILTKMNTYIEPHQKNTKQ